MRSWALAAVLPVVVLGAALGAILLPSSDAPRAANIATFVRDNSLTKVDNPNASELEIKEDAGTALWDHTRRPDGGPCCPGGKWKVAHDWIVPESFTTGEQAQVKLGLHVSDVDPEQQLSFQMSVIAPDFSDALNVQYPDQAAADKTFKFPISAGYADTELLEIKIRVVSAEITYYYKRAPAPALGQTTKPMPEPGESVKTSSPEPIPPKARRADTSVTNSSGSLPGATVVADGSAGEAVAACWLIGPDALNLPARIDVHRTKEKVIDSFAKIDEQIAEARRTGDKQKLNSLLTIRFISCLELVRDLAAAPASSTAAANGCQATRLEVNVQRNRRGRATGLKVVRRKPGRRDVRYSCAVDGPGAITITADGRRRGGLRKGLGRKLDFGVVRERGAAPDSGRLTFRFGV